MYAEHITEKLGKDIQQAIDNAMESMFPYGAGNASHQRVQHHLNQIAAIAFRTGRTHALMGLMTAEDVAEHYRISPRRARALIRNRHQRFGVGMKAGNVWLVHRDELPQLEPDSKYRP